MGRITAEVNILKLLLGPYLSVALFPVATNLYMLMRMARLPVTIVPRGIASKSSKSSLQGAFF
jgi:hypothetical protein